MSSKFWLSRNFLPFLLTSAMTENEKSVLFLMVVEKQYCRNELSSIHNKIFFIFFILSQNCVDKKISMFLDECVLQFFLNL